MFLGSSLYFCVISSQILLQLLQRTVSSCCEVCPDIQQVIKQMVQCNIKVQWHIYVYSAPDSTVTFGAFYCDYVPLNPGTTCHFPLPILPLSSLAPYGMENLLVFPCPLCSVKFRGISPHEMNSYSNFNLI